MNYSIITATLDSARTLDRAVQSVLQQKYSPRDYIFVDGGSNDKTLDLIAEYKALDLVKEKKINIKLIRQNGRGIYNAWNLALERIDTDTDIIFILNSDDWYVSNTSEIVEEAFNNKNIEILSGCASLYKLNAHEPYKVIQPRPLKFFPFGPPLIDMATFVRKSVYSRIGLYDDKLVISGDYEFYYRAYCNQVNIAHSDSVLVNIEEGGVSYQNKNLAATETRIVGSKYCTHKTLPYFMYSIRRIRSLISDFMRINYHGDT